MYVKHSLLQRFYVIVQHYMTDVCMRNTASYKDFML